MRARNVELISLRLPLMLAAALALPGCASRPASDRQPPELGKAMTPQADPRDSRTYGPGPAQVRADVVAAVTDRLGPAVVEQAARSDSSILVAGDWGEFNLTRSLPNVLVRARAGWTSWLSGRQEPIPQPVSDAIDRILADPALWQEDAFSRYADCMSGARAIVVRHNRADRVIRQSCGPTGIAGRLSELIPMPKATAVR